MSGAAIGALVGLGLAVIVLRRRSLATVAVALQSLLLGIAAIAMADGGGSEFVIAGLVLFVRAATLPALFAVIRRRTPEPRLVAAAAPAALRLLIAVVVALAAVAWAPPLGLDDRAAEQGAIALVVLGIATVVLRRPTLFQALGLLVAENGVYLLALSVAGGLPVVIDLVIVLSVVAAFSFRIHRELGSGNTELLRGLRD